MLVTLLEIGTTLNFADHQTSGMIPESRELCTELIRIGK